MQIYRVTSDGCVWSVAPMGSSPGTHPSTKTTPIDANGEPPTLPRQFSPCVTDPWSTTDLSIAERQSNVLHRSGCFCSFLRVNCERDQQWFAIHSRHQHMAHARVITGSKTTSDIKLVKVCVLKGVKASGNCDDRAIALTRMGFGNLASSCLGVGFPYHPW